MSSLLDFVYIKTEFSKIISSAFGGLKKFRCVCTDLILQWIYKKLIRTIHIDNAINKKRQDKMV